MDKFLENPEKTKRTSKEHLENIQEDLWTPENIFEYMNTSWSDLKMSFEHLSATESILSTSENNKNIYRTSENIWNHPENDWEPIIVSLVQFEQDFNTYTEKSQG